MILPWWPLDCTDPKRSQVSREIINIMNDIQQLDILHEKVEMLCEQWEFLPKLSMQINLVLEELVSNIIFYGFPQKGEHQIEICLEFTNGRITIITTDDGIYFDPLQAKSPDLTVPVEERKIGGLGIHFIQQIMDEVKYERKDDKNILTLVKQIE